ncbi:uncharacterized mitochondrial protein AtMg00810-like [Cornus florida]|uniref:uncharacterized mitochondrial protein AtMg00810-like n=1 Tax=Cornus florida TaxID=4283 RepID=UPI00289A6837|nr:uncharacterized mitochondrial protein AtMg00810-like [Cornus florida]
MKSFLGTDFEVKDLGSLRYFLSIEVCRSKKGVFISQWKFVLDLLAETGRLGAKPINIHIEQNYRLNDVDRDPLDDVGRFQRLVRRLIYLSLTFPDIAYAISMISRFLLTPCTPHLEAAHHVLRHLKGSPGKGILFDSYGHLRVKAYTDADWTRSVTNRRSTSRYCTFAEAFVYDRLYQSLFFPGLMVDDRGDGNLAGGEDRQGETLSRAKF